MINTVETNLGLVTNYTGIDFSKYVGKPVIVEELAKRANVAGQFLNWVNLPENQLKRVDEIYNLASKLKEQTGAQILSVLGIGGSKHTVEHMLSVNGLNVCSNKVHFLSDIDTASFERFLARIGGDVTKSNYLVASKSGSTFETKDGMLRIRQMLEDNYRTNGLSSEEASKKAVKHFIAVTDENVNSSELRRTSIEQGWLGDLFIHDDVGGRFSAFDDHALMTLAYAGMKKEDMVAMLNAAQAVSREALSADLDINNPLKQAIFWAEASLNGVKTTVHQYMGDVFKDTPTWHTQMQNESVKDTLKQISKVPDAMHHSAEAHFNPANKFACALTSVADSGVARENAQAYNEALNISYKAIGPYFNEIVDTKALGLTPQAAGALTQSRAFATVYQEIVEKVMQSQELPEVLASVLQPFVEIYKKNLKGGVVIPGRISK